MRARAVVAGDQPAQRPPPLLLPGADDWYSEFDSPMVSLKDEDGVFHPSDISLKITVGAEALKQQPTRRVNTTRHPVFVLQNTQYACVSASITRGRDFAGEIPVLLRCLPLYDIVPSHPIAGNPAASRQEWG